MNLLVIGGGNMGLTYAKSIATNSTNNSITILEKSAEKIASLKTETNFSVIGDIQECESNIDIILLAVKPQVIAEVYESIKPFVQPHQLIISIMAGVTMASINNGLGCDKIVRAMPNLPSQVGSGVTGYVISPQVTEEQEKATCEILKATGTVIKVADEDKIDAITALSGSGPAYVFYFMEAMMSQAEKFGFTEADAKEIVLNTFLGTGALFKASDYNCQEWIDRVTSKGGTTHAALTSFKENQISEHIAQGTEAAYLRAKELSNN